MSRIGRVQSTLCMQQCALHIAARDGQFLALYKLITIHSVDVNITDAWGCTPVDSAVRAGQWPAAVMLMSWGGAHLAHTLQHLACC